MESKTFEETKMKTIHLNLGITRDDSWSLPFTTASPLNPLSFPVMSTSKEVVEHRGFSRPPLLSPPPPLPCTFIAITNN